jgi:peptidoglycan hydrolase-like protein with peptidoglycan-binding domain
MTMRTVIKPFWSLSIAAATLSFGLVGLIASGQAVNAQTLGNQFVEAPFDQTSFGIGISSPVLIQEAEGLLARLGLNPGSVDGVIDAQTFNAVRAYQSRINAPVNGILDERLIDSMRRSAGVTGNLQTANNFAGQNTVGGFSGGGLSGSAVELDVGGLGDTGFLGTVGTFGPGNRGGSGSGVVIPPDIVREAQIHLNALGFGPGVTDGILGRSTFDSIIAFQTAVGLPQDGQLTPQFLEALRQVRGGSGLGNGGGLAQQPVPGQGLAPGYVLVPGFGGPVGGTVGGTFGRSAVPSHPLGHYPPEALPEILEIQSLLSYLGYDVGRVDGIFGPKTARSIIEFQDEVGLPSDGEPTPELLYTLKETLRIAGVVATPYVAPGSHPAQGGFTEFSGPALHGPGGVPGAHSGAPPVGFALVPVGPPTLMHAPGFGPAFGQNPGLVGVPPANGGLAPLVGGTPVQPGTQFGVQPGTQALAPPQSAQAPQPGFAGTSGGVAVETATLPPAAAPANSPLAPPSRRMPDGAPVPLAAPTESISVQPIPTAPVASAPAAPSGQQVVSLQDLVSGRVTLDANGNPVSRDGSTATASGSQGLLVLENEPAVADVAGYSSGLVMEAFKVSSSGQREFLGKVFDTSPMPFGYDSFLQDTGLAPYQDDGGVALKWTGALNILESGTHRIGLESFLADSTDCDVQLSINGLQVLRLQPSRPGTARDTTSLNMSAGPAAFQLFYSCDELLTNAQSFAQISVTGPSERAEAPLAANRLFAKNPFLQ